MRWGTSYYPELIAEAEWASDLAAMQAAGIDTLRLLDFAWTAIEPSEGVYAWEWLDHFIALAHGHGMALILCTPTATPPPWLAKQYPEILIENRDGTLRHFGARRDVDVDSPIYQHFCAGIARAMGERYGHHPAVLGWQIDNELLGPEGVSPECHSRASQWRFRDFLKRRHGTVQTLNQRWGLRFWNQEYSDWGEIDTPRNALRCSLGHWLDYQDFFSQSQRDFIVVQRDALRAVIAARHWISTNATAVFDRGLDHLTFAEPLDMVGWDAYSGAAAGNAACHHRAFTAAAHDLFRAAKGQPFWVFETNPLDHEMTPAFCAEAAARGAAGIVFWHWRPHRANMESGGVAICDLAGRPIAERVARLQTLRACTALTAKVGPLPRRRAAILFSNPCVRAENCPNSYAQSQPLRYLQVFGSLYAALWRLGIGVDVVRPGDDLSAYKLIAAPSLQFLGPDEAAAITAAVAAGATLLGCAKSAHRDQWGTCYSSPGEPLHALLGIIMRWDEALKPGSTVQFTTGAQVTAAPWAERIEVTDGTVLARFVDGSLTGGVAATQRRHGAGQVFYAATAGDEMLEQVARMAAEATGFACPAETFDQVGGCPDLQGGGQWWFNHGSSEIKIGSTSIAAGGFVRLEAAAVAGR